MTMTSLIKCIKRSLKRGRRRRRRSKYINRISYHPILSSFTFIISLKSQLNSMIYPKFPTIIHTEAFPNEVFYLIYYRLINTETTIVGPSTATSQA
jgi:hypothetical protein